MACPEFLSLRFILLATAFYEFERRQLEEEKHLIGRTALCLEARIRLPKDVRQLNKFDIV